jgi:hypothetical protein
VRRSTSARARCASWRCCALVSLRAGRCTSVACEMYVSRGHGTHAAAKRMLVSSTFMFRPHVCAASLERWRASQVRRTQPRASPSLRLDPTVMASIVFFDYTGLRILLPKKTKKLA